MDANQNNQFQSTHMNLQPQKEQAPTEDIENLITNAPESLTQFVSQPDVTSVVIRNSLLSDIEAQKHHVIHFGPKLGRDYRVIYVNYDEITDIKNKIRTVDIDFMPFILTTLDQKNTFASEIAKIDHHDENNLTGKGVLIAIIDTGIDYTKKAFRNEDGTTRIKYIWDQTIDQPKYSGMIFGTEYSEAQINEALKSKNPFSTVPHKDNVGHGTFLASVAGSNEKGDYAGAAPDAEFIIVKLCKADNYFLNEFTVPPLQQNAFSSVDFMLGIEYVLQKAKKLKRPVAICISLGTNSGGHDGYSILEQYLAEVSSETGVAICSAAGNESVGKHHTQGRVVAEGQKETIEVKVEKDNPSFYINLWNNALDRLAVSVISPTGDTIEKVPAKPGTIYSTKFALEKSKVFIEYFFPLERCSSKLTVIKIKDATPGIWTINIYGEAIFDGTFHAWLPITGLVDKGVEFLAPSPNYTITVPATASGAMTCGAYNDKNNSLYVDTSWGPTRTPVLSPDFTALGVNVLGVFPDGYGTMSGTSVAAAVTAGVSALMLQWGIVEKNLSEMNTYLIRAVFISGCDRDVNTDYPNVQWGFGRLDIKKALDILNDL